VEFASRPVESGIALAAMSRGRESLCILGIGTVAKTEGGKRHVIQASRRQTLPQETLPELPCILRELALPRCRDCEDDDCVLQEYILT
jgi:hypothetical protein